MLGQVQRQALGRLVASGGYFFYRSVGATTIKAIQ